jgi:hypothetical protein
MKRVVVRVYAGDSKTKSNPMAESTGFLGSSIATPGSSNVDWTTGSNAATANLPTETPTGTTPTGTNPVPPSGSVLAPPTQTPAPAPAPTQ